MSDELSFDEFARVCTAAGVEDGPEAMKADYEMGQAVGEVIDSICMIIEENPGPTAETAAYNAVDGWLEKPARSTAVLAAAYLIKWAAEIKNDSEN